jgi:hypothetical protein
VVRLLEGDVPPVWLFDPRETDYLHGCGLPEEAARQVGRRLLDLYGVDVFQVKDKPALERALVAFYQQGEARTA